MIERDAVIESLRAEEVAAHYGITGSWRGRWMRSKRCGAADHHTDAMGLSRDGLWHCWVCDTGGDLLKLISLAEGLDIRVDFPRVLEIAAGIAGVVDESDFGGASKPVAPPRPPPPPLEPIASRVALAKKRARWVWERLFEPDRAVEGYLKARGIDLAELLKRDIVKSTPVRVSREYRTAHPSTALDALARNFGVPGLAVAVRSIVDDQLVDIRVRRYEPRADQPKVVGMLGGVVRDGGELHGCYGFPADIPVDTELLVVVEGLADYLTALCHWPRATVLGATDAGSYALVASMAAMALAERGDTSKILLVEQTDESRVDKHGNVIAGAADRGINQHYLAASKRATTILGPDRVGWLECAPHKDLNAAVMAAASIQPTWWVSP